MLDATTIDLCLSLFDWAPFHSTKAAVKMHTLLPAFIHINDGELHGVNVLGFLPAKAGAFSVMDRAYLDFARLYQMPQARTFFVTRAKHGMDARCVHSTTTDRTTGVICDQRIAMNGFYVAKDYPEDCDAFDSRIRKPTRAWCPHQQHAVAVADHCRTLQEPLAGRVVLQIKKAAPSHQEIPRYQRECCEDANLVRRIDARTYRHR